LDKLTHSEHREINPFVNVIRTYIGSGNPYKYQIYLERLGAIPPNVLQLNINPTIKVNESKLLSGKVVKSEYVEVEFQRYTNTPMASTPSTKSWNVKVGIESFKTLEDFKEYLRSIISLFFK
jgi:hypothetical protein